MYRPAVLLPLALWLSGCASLPSRFGPAETRLRLSRVVLYRNGVGYFERAGEVSGQVLTIRCRKDQINDVLKSLTVVDRRNGQAVSVSMPLDPQRWASAAAAVLSPGSGNLSRVLDALRGTHVDLTLRGGGHVGGRVLLVEELPGDKDSRPDQRISLLDGTSARVALLSRVVGVRFRDGDVALQLHRSLDASAGEGMFKQVTVSVRLAGPSSHDLSLSYVVAAPVWQPTYRLVLPEEGAAEALLQSWAVVGNTSGEDWADVKISLTAGAPIAFRYDLHTPRDVARTDVTSRAHSRQAEVAMGETTLEEAPAPPPPPPGAGMPMGGAPMPGASPGGGGGGYGSRAKMKRAPSRIASEGAMRDDAMESAKEIEAPAAVDMSQLQRSTGSSARARRVSGLTQFDLRERVSVPDGTATMVAVLNQRVPAEQVFLYRPGGSGAGFEENPYRVVRFKNITPFVLEPGPISVYASGSFVGEGISESIAADTSATIPFAVEPSIAVTSTSTSESGAVRLLRVHGGVLSLETFARHVTRWTVRGPKQERPYKVLIRHSRRSSDWTLRTRPAGLEEVPGAYLVPVAVDAGRLEGGIEVAEQTPVRSSVTIWDGQAEGALQSALSATNLTPEVRARLTPVLTLRHEIAQIDVQLDGLRRQQQTLDQRAQETRSNLEAIKKDPRATALRDRLSGRLEEFTREGDALGRRLVDLNSRRLEKKIGMDELLTNFEFEAPPAG